MLMIIRAVISKRFVLLKSLRLFSRSLQSPHRLLLGSCRRYQLARFSPLPFVLPHSRSLSPLASLLSAR